MENSQTFPKAKENRYTLQCPHSTKSKAKHISFSFSSSSAENSDQKESEKNTWGKVSLPNFFETQIKE